MMRKSFILIALVAAPAALAAPEPTAVNITAEPALVTYGSQLRLAGSVTPAHQIQVEVAAKTCLNAPARAGTTSSLKLKSDKAGAWSVTVAPQVRTLYQATAKDVQSELVMVQVRPRVTLERLARHKFRTRVYAAMSFEGKTASFQKRTPVGWRTVKRVPLRFIDDTADAVVSGKTFRSGVSQHKTLRILLAQRQVGNCYAAGIGNSVRG